MIEQKTRSVVIAPFDAPGQRVLDTVRRSLSDLGVEVWELRETRAGTSWADEITNAIRTCDFLVVDVTRQNPNVLYEVGYAHALRKPTILIVKSELGGAVPSALAGLQYFVYDMADLGSLAGHLRRVAPMYMMQGV